MGLSEETSQERDQFDTNQDDATTDHELFDALALGTRVIVAITFEQVDNPPDGETRHSQGNDQDFENVDCFVEKFHMLTLLVELAPRNLLRYSINNGQWSFANFLRFDLIYIFKSVNSSFVSKLWTRR